MQDVWGEDARGEYVWTAGNVREAIPDVMTPCTWSVVQPYIEESAGPRIQAGHPLFGLIAGRLYMNMSVGTTAARRMGASWMLDQISAQAFGSIPEDIEVTPLEMSRLDVLRTVGAHQMRVRVWTLVHGLRLERLLRKFSSECDRLLDEIPAADNRQELLSLWEDQIGPVFARACKIVRFSAPAWMAMAVHYRIVGALIGEDNANAVTSGSTGSDDLASLDLVLALEDLRAGSLDERTFVRRFGHRGPHEHELSMPRPGEDPSWIADQVRAPIAPGTVRAALSRRQQQLHETWRSIRATKRIRSALARWHASSWGRAARTRERTRSEATRVFWVIRSFVERAGHITGHGQDLYMLTIDEITRVLAEDSTPLAQVAERRALHERRCAMAEPPMVFRGPIQTVRRSPVPSETRGRAGTLVGQPGAPGVVTGVARVVHDIADAGELRQGEVLVTRLTNVGWTPLFITAAAVVTDIGAVLSHAAIVARELGLPAVVGTGDATEVIRTGDTVTVDGLAGSVTITAVANAEAPPSRQLTESRSAVQPQAPRQRRTRPLTSAARPTPTTTVLTVRLPARIGPADIGGKASGLNELLTLGISVPAAGVVTTAAYRRFMTDPGLAWRAEYLAGGGASADEIDAAFLETDLDPELERAIHDLAEAVGGRAALAVRSSATSEDAPGASSAGQYRTLLDVDRDDIIRSVRLVWASVWHPAPTAYRTHRGTTTPPDMAVVLMPMIDAELAGVIFTRDPVGSRDKVRVEAVAGTADQLVAGTQAPESWVLPRDEREPSNDERVDELIAASLRLENHLGAPQDIEWAHDGERLWILQARPITT